MRRKVYGSLALICVFYALTGVWSMYANHTFNKHMNEDIGIFMSSFQNARTDSDRAQALRTVLLNTKQNTNSLVGSVNNVFSAVLFNFMLVATIRSLTTRPGDEKDRAGPDRSPKDADNNEDVHTARRSPETSSKDN